MALAVKNTPEVGAGISLGRLPVICLVGVVYILGCFAIVLKLLPSLWWPFMASMGVAADSMGAGVLLGMVMLVAGTALIILGTRLLGPNAPTGSRAGIFLTLVGLLMVLLLTRWVSMWVEHWVYIHRLFSDQGPTIGAAITAVVGLGLLAYAVRLLFKKKTERSMIAFEAQGWFSANAYKPLQGQKVRRGTILGLLLTAGAGIYTMLAHDTLKRTSPDWGIIIPFTGMVTVDNPGDVGPFLARFPTKDVKENNKIEKYPVVSRYELRAINDDHADPTRYIKVTDAIYADGLRDKVGEVIEKKTFDDEVKRMLDQFEREHANVDDAIRVGLLEDFKSKRLPKGVPPEPATGTATFETLTLLPGLKFTFPLLLLAGSLWLAWRVVNMPTFADFLIATEAELNKVSWTTRKRLFQDTIVVLTCVIMMAGFLFVMDQSWRIILSWKPIGVLVFPEDEGEKNKSVEEKQW